MSEPIIDLSELNPRFVIWMLIIIGFAAIAIYPIFAAQPVIEKPNMTVKEVIIKEVMVYPTPDGIKIYAPTYESGVRKLNHPFSFIRKNVTGNYTTQKQITGQDLMITSLVYNYIILEDYSWFNPADYFYYREQPQEGYKYIFVCFVMWMDNDVYDDTRFWLPKEHMINLQYRDTVYSSVWFPKQLRIKELETVPNYNNDAYIKAYGQYRAYNPEESAVKTAGEISIDEYYLRGGKSNAQDGYLLFEIPKEARAEDLIFHVSFYELGYSGWRLTTNEA